MRKFFLETSLALLAAAVLLFTGCGSPFSRALLEQTEKNVRFEDLRKNPELYRGKLLLLAGMVVETKNQKNGTLIEVLQKPLNRDGSPKDTDQSDGRFLILSTEFLDPAVYHRGRMISVVGESVGGEMQLLGEMEYFYPVLQARAVHLWPPYSGPRFSIGIGVYHGF